MRLRNFIHLPIAASVIALAASCAESSTKPDAEKSSNSAKFVSDVLVCDPEAWLQFNAKLEKPLPEKPTLSQVKITYKEAYIVVEERYPHHVDFGSCDEMNDIQFQYVYSISKPFRVEDEYHELVYFIFDSDRHLMAVYPSFRYIN